jgi:hypothetical protein
LEGNDKQRAAREVIAKAVAIESNVAISIYGVVTTEVRSDAICDGASSGAKGSLNYVMLIP